MVAYDFSKEPNNPWDAAVWNPRAQIDFTRRMRSAWPDGSAESRITQRIAQSDTKGIPPAADKKKPPFQIIIEKRYLAPPTRDVVLGFGMAGAVEALTQWTLPVATQRVTFPSTTPSDARCDVAPTGTVVLTLSDANNVILCAVEFESGQTTGTFTWTPPPNYILQPGALLYLFVEGPQDATFAGVNVGFVGRTVAS